MSLQELRREFKISLHLARKLFSEVRTQAHHFVSLSDATGFGAGQISSPSVSTNRSYPTG